MNSQKGPIVAVDKKFRDTSPFIFKDLFLNGFVSVAGHGTTIKEIDPSKKTSSALLSMSTRHETGRSVSIRFTRGEAVGQL